MRSTTLKLEALEDRQLPSVYFVDALKGHDYSSGLLGHPWQTLDRVNRADSTGQLKNGDTVSLHVQDTPGQGIWNGHLDFTHDLTLNSYGGTPAGYSNPTLFSGQHDGITFTNTGGTVNDINVWGEHKAQLDYTSFDTMWSVGGFRAILFQNRAADAPYYAAHVSGSAITGPDTGVALIGHYDGVTIDLVNINNAGDHANDLRMSGIQLQWSENVGDGYSQSRNVRITNCYVSDVAGYSSDPSVAVGGNGDGIVVNGGANVVIDSCQVENVGSNGAVPIGIGGSVTTDFTISNCIVEHVRNGYGPGGADGDGIDGDAACRRVTVTNCFINDCDGTAVQVGPNNGLAGGGTTGTNYVTDCTISNVNLLSPANTDPVLAWGWLPDGIQVTNCTGMADGLYTSADVNFKP